MVPSSGSNDGPLNEHSEPLEIPADAGLLSILSGPPRVRAARTLALLFVGTGVLSIGAAVASADFSHIWWYSATTVTALLAAFVGFRLPRVALKNVHHIVGAVAAGTLLIALAEGLGFSRVVGLAMPAGERMALWFGNANILAACLALIGLYLFQWGPTRLGVLVVCVTVVDLAFTGSRGAITGFAASTATLLLLPRVNGPSSVRWLRALIPVVLIGAGLFAIQLFVPSTRNLLHESANLQASPWTPMTSSISMKRVSTSNPRGNRGAWSLTATPSQTGVHPGLVLSQSVGRSRIGREYVASVYVKAAKPTRFVLSTNLSSATCDVSTAWSRCTTPPAQGDGRRIAQFQVRTLEPGNHLAIELWGPQLEYGEHATAVVQTHRFTRTLDRLDPLSWPNSYGWRSRVYLQRMAWRLFLQHPLAGTGRGSIHRRLLSEGTEYSTAQHAQNQPLNLLVEAGILGLAAWALPVLGMMILARRRWRAWLPLMVLCAVLNTVDATFFTAGFFYLFWFLLGATANHSGTYSCSWLRSSNGAR